MSDLKLEQGMNVLHWGIPGYTFVAGPDSDDYYVLKDPQGQFVFASLNGISLPVLFHIDGAPVRQGDTVYFGKEQVVVLSYDVATMTVTGSKGEAHNAGCLHMTPQLEHHEAFVVLVRDSLAMEGVTALCYPYPTREMAVEAHADAFLIVKAEWEE